MKKLCASVLALTLVFGWGRTWTAVSAAQPCAVAPPSVSARSAILINAEDEAVYFAQCADEPLGMASTTKLMTALVVAEGCSPDAVVTVTADAVGIEGSSIYLTEGEQLTVRELLYAMLLASANDAATALAVFAAGSVDAFCAQMNTRAEAMGLRHTHFTNPHGLFDDDHYTTARELASIAAHVLRIPLLREIVGTHTYTISLQGVPHKRYLTNHNKLLRTYDGALGMKTGFTKKTGRTLVSAAERDGLTLIAVTLDAPDDWRDHTAMLDYGFASYETVVLAPTNGFFYALPVSDGNRDCVLLTNTEPLTMTLPKGHGAPTYTVEGTAHFLCGAVACGQTVGRVTAVCDGKTVSSPLTATHAVATRTPVRRGILARLRDFFRISVCVGVADLFRVSIFASALPTFGARPVASLGNRHDLFDRSSIVRK